MSYNDSYYFPALLDLLPNVSPYYPGEKFNQQVPGEADYRKLNKKWMEKKSANWLIMPFYESNPYEDITAENNKMFEKPSKKHYFVA